MYKWYADDSAFKKNHGDSKRHVYLFGGILISREDEVKLSEIIKSVKREYTGEDMPIKYNMKDNNIEEVYKRFQKEEEYKKLLAESATWRTRIIQESLNFDYKIFIALIENFQADKKNQKPIKDDLSSFLFSNALMRVGLHSGGEGFEHVQVVLDWPEGNHSKPFDKEYYYAYNRGTNSDGQEFFSGPLKDIGFDQTLYYARCNHSNMLQLSDIILGATRDWIETELQGREYSIGQDLSKQFLSKFYGYPRNVLGYGINVSSNNQTLKNELKKLINKNVA
ncbi:MAG: DUF3800 domain-containing protein [Crocinitomicaceae bacterium]|nr:DUF3800 domain-containing protein [Crocinitomicaceae bacterium]